MVIKLNDEIRQKMETLAGRGNTFDLIMRERHDGLWNLFFEPNGQNSIVESDYQRLAADPELKELSNKIVSEFHALSTAVKGINVGSAIVTCLDPFRAVLHRSTFFEGVSELVADPKK